MGEVRLVFLDFWRKCQPDFGVGLALQFDLKPVFQFGRGHSQKERTRQREIGEGIHPIDF